MAHFNLCVPTQFTDRDGNEKTRYTRVGALFENHNRNTGEVFYTMKLDFPVGATDLVAFPPKARDDEEEG